MRRDIPDCLKPVAGRPWRRPLDERDVAVRLEADGISDGIAQSVWGYSSTWDIARDCYRRLPGIEEYAGAMPRKSEIAEHLKGMSFALPLALCCVAMVFLKFSLWGGDLPADIAAAVAIGTVSSFAVTGGIVQAMARQGLFYLGTGELRMAEIVCHRWFGYGLIALGASALFGLAHNALFAGLPYPLLWTATAFHLALGVFWLATGVLYMLEQNLLVTVAALTGIAVVGLLHMLLGVGLIPSQLAGIVIAAVFAAAVSRWLLRKRAATEAGRVHRLIPWRTLYLTAPYILYGCLYYLFLFSDRVMAWSAQTSSASLPILFRGDYELPLDIALFAFVLEVGWVHSSMLRFYAVVGTSQRSCEIELVHKFNEAMRRFYIGRVVRFLPLAVAMSLFVWSIARASGLLEGSIAQRVLLPALAGYPFLVIALWNVSLLFALSQPKAVLPAIACGLIANSTVGYMLSRLVSYEWAVTGFAIGALTFAAVSSAAVLRRFRDLDYFNFAAAA
jgi:uncharacterized membrane protein